MSRIVLHIDRLLLRGIDPNDAEAFSIALQDELRQLLAEDGGRTLLANGHRAAYRPSPLQVQAQSNAETLARAVAPHVLPGSQRGEP